MQGPVDGINDEEEDEKVYRVKQHTCLIGSRH
jgi:hypothetical protein